MSLKKLFGEEREVSVLKIGSVFVDISSMVQFGIFLHSLNEENPEDHKSWMLSVKYTLVVDGTPIFRMVLLEYDDWMEFLYHNPNLYQGKKISEFVSSLKPDYEEIFRLGLNEEHKEDD